MIAEIDYFSQHVTDAVISLQLYTVVAGKNCLSAGRNLGQDQTHIVLGGVILLTDGSVNI